MNNELKINVFISWSGLKSGEVAKVLHNWIDVALQFTNPYLSKNIGAGKRWSNDVASNLEQTNFGILVLTEKNIHSDWILFEAGALTKHLGESRVIPCLIDLEPSDIGLPLSDFQAVKLPEDILSVVKALNEEQPDPWDGSKLQRTFDAFKEKFFIDYEHAIEKSKSDSKKSTKPRTIEDKVEEVLQIVRGLPHTSLPQDHDVHAEQFYPINDRIQLYKFLKKRVNLPLYKKASMPALFEAAADFIKLVKPNLSDDEALLEVARYLINDRPLMALLNALENFEEIKS